MNAHAAPGLRRLALTGATGFVGGRLVAGLKDVPCRVRALYRPRPGRQMPVLPNVEWVPGSLEDAAALRDLVAGVDAVVHCAGAVRGATRADFDRVNVAGTRRLAEAAADAGCARFLLLSSLAAREPGLSDYAGSKAEGESVLAAQESVAWTVFRPPAVYGPGDKELLPLLKAIGRGFAPLPAGGKGRFSMIYVDDLASAVVAWLKHEVAAGQTFELDDGREGGYDWDGFIRVASRVLRDGRSVRRLSIPRVALTAFGAVNRGLSRLVGYAPMLTPGKVRELVHADWVADGSAFTQATGWRPAYDLERGLVSTFGARQQAPQEIQ